MLPRDTPFYGRTDAPHIAPARCAASADASLVPTDVQTADERPVPIRFLGGWALHRGDGLRDAIDLASAAGANRVLYNGWGWTPNERVRPGDAELTEYARARGVELVFELRRMSFGTRFDIREPGAILSVFDDAVASGFRVFGFLFDDVPWETADDECGLIAAIDARLTEHLGEPPELYCCPQFYWNPGEMNSAWTGRADAAEIERQARYLETYGRRLPPNVRIYIANYWGGHPPGYESALDREFTARVGRKPIYFDNQLINDYRSGALLPVPLVARPRDFADHYAGYYLNAPRPFAAFAPAIASALVYASSPGTYDPATAMGRSIEWLYGPSNVRVGLAREAFELTAQLATEWAGGVHTAVDHYRTIWSQLRDGSRGSADIAEWRRTLGSARRLWTDAAEEETESLSAVGLQSLRELARGSTRLERDLDLFSAYLGTESNASFGRSFDAVADEALAAVGELLPRAPGLGSLLRRFAEFPSTTGAAALPEPANSPAWSWVEYFYDNTGRSLRRLRGEMDATRSGRTSTR